MAIGITPDDVFPYILARERVQPEPKPPKANGGEAKEAWDAKVAAFEVVLADWKADKERVLELIAKERVTTWSMRCLSSRNQNRLIQNIDQKDPEWQFHVARVGLSGWKNLRARGPDGKLIEFAGSPATVLGIECPNAPSMELLDRVGLRDVSELASAFLNAQVTEEELGNS